MQVSYFICRTVENVDKSTPDLDDDAGLLMANFDSAREMTEYPHHRRLQ